MALVQPDAALPDAVPLDETVSDPAARRPDCPMPMSVHVSLALLALALRAAGNRRGGPA